MGIHAGKLSSPDFLDKRGIDTKTVSKHLHKDNNIYERDHKNGKAACAYKHFTQQKSFLLYLGSHEGHHAICHKY